MRNAPLSRRAALAGLGLAITTGAVSAAAGAPTAITTANDAVDRLWRRYVVLIAEARKLAAAEKRAEAALPAWANRGPQYCDLRGRLRGFEVGWPLEPAGNWIDTSLGHRICRPGPRDLKAWFEREAEAAPDARAVLRKQYRKRMRSLTQRIRAQREEKQKVGLPAIQAGDERNYDERWEVLEAIRNGTPCPNGAAALFLTDHEYHRRDDALGSHPGLLGILSHLAPSLTGLLREHAEIILSEAERASLTKFGAMPFVSA